MLRTTRCIKITTFFALAVLLAAPLYAAPANGGVADVLLGTTQVDWVPVNNSSALTLVVSGPEGVVERSFEAGDTPSFDLTALTGNLDGSYSWQLTAAPELSAESRRLMAEARANGTTFVPGDLPPRDELVQSGHFRVVGGAIVQPDVGPEPELAIDTGGDTVGVVSDAVQFMAEAAQTIATDLIVQGSLCVGVDCTSSESFGFDTIRLKENNLRIKFQDTSNSGSFPTTDWQITINGSNNGDPSYYRVEDVTNNKRPFTIEANTPNNTLYVDSTGRVGIGTDLPVVEAHIQDGDTPTLRLQQDGSSGFAQQIWDVAGNETNFFVRDVTNASKLPFRIKPGAPDSSVFIAANGDVGVGTDSPAYDLHITDSGASVQDLLSLDATNATAQTVRMRLANAANTWFTGVTSLGNLTFNAASQSGIEAFITEDGDMTITGTLTTGGTECNTGCDLVFAPDYELPSIDEHAEAMFANRYLPSVGPTAEGEPFNLTEMTGGMLNELEKAHIYISQLHDRLGEKESQLSSVQEQLEELRAAVDALRTQE